MKLLLGKILKLLKLKMVMQLLDLKIEKFLLLVMKHLQIIRNYTLNYVVHLSLDLVTTRLNTLVSVLVTIQQDSQQDRKYFYKIFKTSMLRRSVKTAVSSSTRV